MTHTESSRLQFSHEFSQVYSALGRLIGLLAEGGEIEETINRFVLSSENFKGVR